MTIAALTIVRDMAPTLAATFSSLSWVDVICLFDDGSQDESVQIAQESAAVPLILESIATPDGMLRSGELETRNAAVKRAFALTGAEALVLIDADEIMSSSLESLVRAIPASNYSSIALACYHLFTNTEYLHIYEAEWNGVRMADPHVRVITQSFQYVTGVYDDCKHPFIQPRPETLCVALPYHIHLKYLRESPYLNISLPFLPARVTREAAANHLRPLPIELPADLRMALEILGW